jgi:hypothetical protein
LKYLNPKVVHGAAFDRTIMAPAVRVTTDDAAVVPARQTRAHFPSAMLVRNSGEEIELRRVLHRVGVPGKQLAVINRRPQGYFVTHVSGRRTPRVNGDRIGAEPRLLKSGETIEVAGEALQFFLKT